MARGSLKVGDKTFTFKPGDESELDAYMEAKRHLRELHRKAAAKQAPKLGPNLMALDPSKGPGRRSARQYDIETGELYPNNPHYEGSEYDVKTANKRRKNKKGDVVLEPAAARMKVKS